jgi:hypothetical protein
MLIQLGHMLALSFSLSLSLFLLQADSEVCGVEFAFSCIQKSLPCIISEVW